MTLSDDYELRLFQRGDESWLSEITLAAIREVGARRYSPEQVAAWASRHPSPERFRTRAEAGAYIIVGAFQKAEPVAYALLEMDEHGDGHLDMLYCHPRHTRKGLAEALLARCEGQARVARAARLYTEASELARSAFERAGYAATHRRDFTIEGPDGHTVPIHNFAMEKRLD